MEEAEFFRVPDVLPHPCWRKRLAVEFHVRKLLQCPDRVRAVETTGAVPSRRSYRHVPERLCDVTGREALLLSTACVYPRL